MRVISIATLDRLIEWYTRIITEAKRGGPNRNSIGDVEDYLKLFRTFAHENGYPN